MTSDAGKGDTPRPVNRELWEAGWKSAFGETEEEREEALTLWKRLKSEAETQD